MAITISDVEVLFISQYSASIFLSPRKSNIFLAEE